MHYGNFACFRGTRSRQSLSGTYGSGFSFAGTSSAPVFSENLTEAPPLLGRVPLAAKSTSGAVLRIIILFFVIFICFSGKRYNFALKIRILII